MGLRQTVAPAKKPVTLRELKTQLVIECDDENVRLEGLLAAATIHVEGLTRRQLITATWELTLDHFPRVTCREHRRLLLPRPRLQAIGSVQYVDLNGDTQTWSALDYRVDTKSEPGRLEPAYGKTWPITRCVSNAVTITFSCGYGLTGDTVPENLRHAVKILAAFMYENRGADLSNVPAVDALVDQYVIPATALLETLR